MWREIRWNRSARVEKIKVETYRANQIEMFDTCAMRLRTAEDTEMLYLVAHPIARSGARNPEFIYEFENGTVSCKADEHMMRSVLSDGTQLLYGDPNADQTRKMAWMIATMQEKTPVLCGPEAASEHTKCINKIEELIPGNALLPGGKDQGRRRTGILRGAGCSTWPLLCGGKAAQRAGRARLRPRPGGRAGRLPAFRGGVRSGVCNIVS